MALIKINVSPHLLVIFCLLNAVVLLVNAENDISNINVTEIQSQLPAKLANLKNKCIEVAGKEKGEEAFQRIEAAARNLGECISNIINLTKIQGEINEAGPRGELDVVFGKYCLKRPEALECVESFNVRLLPCVDQEEKDYLDVLMRIVRKLLNFICYMGGDRIALFFAENGPECFESKMDGIKQCINSTFSNYVTNGGIENAKLLLKFIMDPKRCKEIEALENCVISKLYTCDEITPANIIESTFRFIKNETMCSAKRSDSGGLLTSTLVTPLA